MSSRIKEIYLPCSLNAGDLKYQFVDKKNNWCMYRISARKSMYETIRYEIFIPENYGDINFVQIDVHTHEGYPTEKAFEARVNAFRFGTLIEAAEFLESR